jgi:ribose transport system substrate-binding protein
MRYYFRDSGGKKQKSNYNAGLVRECPNRPWRIERFQKNQISEVHMSRIFSVLGLCLAATLLWGCDNGASTPSGGGSTTAPAATGAAGGGAKGDITIAVIPKGTTHPYWKSVHAGAEAAATELGVKIIWKGPLMENDRAQEIGIVEQFVSDGVSGIVLAPLDSTALVRPVTSAKDKNIPVVIIDSGLKAEAGKDFTSFVATNNKLGGSLGGDELARLIGGKGKVVLLRYAEGSASTEEREAGFLEAMAKHPDITVTVKDRYGNPTAAEAQTTAMNIIDQIKEADGIFCPNESTTFGMLLALRQNNLAGKKNFVGFDTSKELMEALQKGEINALVAQDPKKMGYEGVKTCVAAIKGEKVEPNIDSGCALITKEKLDDPAIKKMLQVE